MRRSRGILTAAAAVPLILLGACAQPAGDPGGGNAASGATKPTTEGASAAAAGANDLVIRISSEGGFVPAERIAGRLPRLSVYGDGRVITEGPSPAIYPGPAMPNILVQQITPELVQQLVKDGLSAGVRTGTDYGTPNVADAPSTRVTIVTAGGPQTVVAAALDQARANDTRLTGPQQNARGKLQAYVKKLDGLAAQGKQTAYEPVALAALSRPWAAQSDVPGQQNNEKAWTGPTLPGPVVNGIAEQNCVVVSGAQIAPTLAAVKTANSVTAWTSNYKKWLITFRPLLPDETGCDALAAQK